MKAIGFLLMIVVLLLAGSLIQAELDGGRADDESESEPEQHTRTFEGTAEVEPVSPNRPALTENQSALVVTASPGSVTVECFSPVDAVKVVYPTGDAYHVADLVASKANESVMPVEAPEE